MLSRESKCLGIINVHLVRIRNPRKSRIFLVISLIKRGIFAREVKPPITLPLWIYFLCGEDQC